MMFPQMNMRRVYLIARRDFLGYIKTWGFWISFFLPFIFVAVGYGFSQLNVNVEPIRYETIIDETGDHKAGIIAEFDEQYLRAERRLVDAFIGGLLSGDEAVAAKKIYREQGFEAIKAYLDKEIPGVGKNLKAPEKRTIFVNPPAQTLDGLQPFLKDEKTFDYKGAQVGLDGVLYIRKSGTAFAADYWSPNINNPKVKNAARNYFRNRAASNYLSTGNLSMDGLNAARRGTISIDSFDPTKETSGGAEGQAVTDKDQIPYLVAAILSMMLWLTIFSGSYMLLTSMLEEKLNKLMEMMLASVRFSEIIFGKLIGVAALTFAAMFPYIMSGVVAVLLFIFAGDPEVAAGITQAFTPKLIIFFIIFLVLGYIFYGALFIALGALAESMQDAQTLTTPIMLILTSCVMVVPLGVSSPDSPILEFAAWFPLSAPFAAIMTLPSDPPWWELALSALFVFVLSIGVIWVAGRIFRFGVLSGTGVKGIKSWFARVIFRRKPA